MPPTAEQPGGMPPRLDDDTLLRELGYEPVLSRRMGQFGNFAISFSIISVLTGCMTLYGFGLGTGGPAVMLWGWAAVGAFVLLVGMALAEVTSAYPTSGALYYMARQLGGPRWGWYTGWLNLLGLLGGLASGYGAALFIGAFANLQWGFDPTPRRVMAIFACLLVVYALFNVLGVRLVSMLNSISVWWHIAGIAVIVVTLAVAPDHHQSAGFVLGHWNNDTGWSSNLYVACLGLLLAQYTLTGYDASAHLSEETTKASVTASRGIVRAIWMSWVAGFVLLAGLTWAIQDYAGTQGSATGVPPAQIFLDAVGGTGAKLLLLIVIGAQMFCGNAAVASCARMVFAFSRDRALPGSTQWRRVSPRTGIPTRAVWLSVTVGFVLALPALSSDTAFGAVTAINVIGMTPAYAIPIFLRLRAGRRFVKGPWHLGRWSRPVAWTAVAWVLFVTVLFCLPQTSPVTVDSFNYASIALVAVLLLATVTWWAHGRRAYRSPVYTSDPELAALDQEIV